MIDISRAAVSAIALLALTAGCNSSSDPQNLMVKVQEYRAKGDYQAAIIELKNVLQKNPDHAGARHQLGAEYLDAGDPRAAEAELERALKLSSDPVKVVPDLAKAKLMQGKFQEVLET